MIRKIRNIFRPTPTTSGTSTNGTTSKSSMRSKANNDDEALCEATEFMRETPSSTEQPSSDSSTTANTSSNISNDDTNYAKMRNKPLPIIQLRDISRSLLSTSSSSSFDLLSNLLSYGQSLGASKIHGYLVECCDETQTSINQENTSFRGKALCITYDITLTEQHWKDAFGHHESNSTVTQTTSSSSSILSNLICILSGSRIVYYDSNEGTVQEEKPLVSSFDLQHDDIDLSQDQFSSLSYFFSKSKTSFNGTLICLPLLNHSRTQTKNQTNKLQDFRHQISRYFESDHSLIDLLLVQCNINEIIFESTIEFQTFSRFFSLSKQSQTIIRNGQSVTEIFNLSVDVIVDDVKKNAINSYLLSNYTDYSETLQCKIDLKILLPLNQMSLPMNSSISNSTTFKHHSLRISSLRTLYYSTIPPLSLLPKTELYNQLRQMKFPQAYSLFLRDLSRLIKPTSTSNLSIDLIWELMPDVDEYQRLLDENPKDPIQQQHDVQIVNQLIPDIWAEIGKQELFYSVTDGWGYVAIEDMIINNVQAGPIQDVLTYVFSEANAPIVILPTHVINGLCKYSNKHYLQVMTPFHASELLAKNMTVLSRLNYDQKISLLKYILLNDPDPGLVLELELLPLANGQFTTFKTKRNSAIYILDDSHSEFFKLFHHQQHSLLLNPNIDANLFQILTSKNFQDRTQLQSMTAKDIGESLEFPNEWRRNEDYISWPRNHEFYNISWLENLWRTLNEKFPDDLSIVEDKNILYSQPSPRSNGTNATSTISLYRLSKSIGLIQLPAVPSKDDLAIQKVLVKLNFYCVEPFPEIIRRHKLIEEYVPQLSCTGLLNIFKRRLRHFSSNKIQQEFNTLLNEHDIKLLRQYLSKISPQQLDGPNIDCIKQLPIFDNAFLNNESSAKLLSQHQQHYQYISLSKSLYIYESGTKLPIDLQANKHCIHVTDNDSKVLLDKLGCVIHDFTHVARYLITTIGQQSQQQHSSSGQTNFNLNSKHDQQKMILLGKWLLTNCGNLIMADRMSQDTLPACRLFLNRKGELCSSQQMFDPTSFHDQEREKYMILFESKYFPSLELCSNQEHFALLKRLKMKKVNELRADELIDICEFTIKELVPSTINKRELMILLADFIIDMLNQNPKLIDEYCPSLKMGLKQYLSITPWIPIMIERPLGYPSSLTWYGSTIDSRRAFCCPRDVYEKNRAVLVGATGLCSSIDFFESFKIGIGASFARSPIDFHEIKLEIIIKQLKSIVQCYPKSLNHQQKNESLEYFNLCKRIYDFLSHINNPTEILKEMRIGDVVDWIWNGASGYSSINHIYSLDKNHPLANYVQCLPYELNAYRKFFESMGVKHYPDSTKVEDILRSQQSIDEHAFKWIKEHYSNDRRLSQIINELETKTHGRGNNKTKSIPDDQTRITFTSTLDLSENKIYLYLTDIFNKQNNIKECVIQALSTISKDKKTQLLSEEDYFIRKMSGSEYQKALYDHYRAYNDLLLPNLNVLPKNVKDTIVLFALDHADTLMISILKQHCCIPCTPSGRTLNKPSKLIHPFCRLASLYSDVDSLFPYGGQDSYLREDRLNVLKLLGMKCDDNLVTWPELVDRCESIPRMRDYHLAYQRSVSLLQILNDMLSMSNNTTPRMIEEHEELADRRSRTNNSTSRDTSTNMSNGISPASAPSSIFNTHEALHDKEARTRASTQMREIAFIPIKQRPAELNGVNLPWMGDKYPDRMLKPKDVLSQQFEQLVCSAWPIAEQCKTGQDQVYITRQVEHFLGLDDATKIELKDILKQLDEIGKSAIMSSSSSVTCNHQAASKYLLEMSYAIYDYLQEFCFPFLKQPTTEGVFEYRSAHMSQTELDKIIREVREVFSQRRLVYFTDPSSSDNYLFLSVSQLVWQFPTRSSNSMINNLKPYYYPVPNSLHKSYKHFFLELLQIKSQIDGKDLLNIIEQVRKKYGTKPLDKDDFTLLQNVYTLLVEQYSTFLHSNMILYLPNLDCVLHPGSSLFYYPYEREQTMSTSSSSAQDEHYVHPSVDRRMCLKAGVKTRKTQTIASNISTTSNQQPNVSGSSNTMPMTSSRLFPKIFGNKKLESILARLDEPHINPQLVETMDESNPNIVLEFLLESNKYTQITNSISDDDIIIILKYFNDFLLNGYQGNFQKLRELKIYKPLWGLTSSEEKQHPPIQQCCSLENFAQVHILNEEWSNLIRRSFKRNFFTEQFHEKKNVLLMQKKIEPLSKIFTHLRFILPSDVDIFTSLCLPNFRKLDAKAQANLLKYFLEEVEDKLFPHEKELCRKKLHDQLEIFTQTSTSHQDHTHKNHFGISRSARDPPEICSVYELYDPNIKNIRSILGVHHFPDEHFHTPSMLKFLKECGLRSYIPTDKCKQIMESIQLHVKQEGWNNDLRKRSRYLYEHLLNNWTRYDNSILDYKFLEPYQMQADRDKLLKIHEQFHNTSETPANDQLRYTCIKLSEGELLRDVKLCWTASYVLPDFVRIDQNNDFDEQRQTIDQNAIEFFKLNKKPTASLVMKNLSNLAKKFSLKYQRLNDVKASSFHVSQEVIDEVLTPTLKSIYHYFQHEIKLERRTEIYKEFEDRECIYSRTRRQFLPGKYFCLNLPMADEIPPFLFSIDQEFFEFKEFFVQIGVQSEPHPMLFGDILRKLSKVCDQDYLNSNELCKSLKAMECFFKYLSVNTTITAQTKLPGLYLVTNDIKLVKSNEIVIMDDKTKLDYMTKLTHDKFLFNPNEKVFRFDSNSSTSSKTLPPVSNIKEVIEKIFISQRPVLFTQKYEESFSITIPEDEESHRQRFLHNLERKYSQLLSSRHLHRCMARVIANHVARQENPKIISMDDVENLIRQRLAFVKTTCVEYLETNLIYRKTQQKVDQSVDEKAVYLVAEGTENITLYISMKHTEQPYFTLCLARALSPCLGLSELQLDNSVMAALLATTIGQMSKLLNLVNVAMEDSILSILKLQYIPSPGNVYGDDIAQLQQFNVEQHQILPGDLCVYRANDLYIYCEVEEIIKEYATQTKDDSWPWKKTNSSSLIPTYAFLCRINDGKEVQRIEASNFYVLEHWSRIFDAVNTKPVDERESFKSSTSSSSASNNQGKYGGGVEKEKQHDKFSSSSHNSGKHNSDTNGSSSDPGYTNGFDSSKTYRQTSADSDSSSNPTSESQSESESAQNSEQDLIDKAELEATKSEIYNAVRQAYQLSGQERKKTVKKLLLKWHPDKNPGRERFAAEVFKHLRKQIDHFENDPLTSLFNSFNNFHHSPFSASDPKFSWNKTSSTSKPGYHSSSSASAKPQTSEDRFNGFDSYNKDQNDDTKRSYQDIPNGNHKEHTDHDENSTSNGTSGKSRFSPHRSSSFRTAREEWQYRRQHGFQRRHGFFNVSEDAPNCNGTSNTNTNSQTSSSSTSGKESPNARRKRNYQQSEADRWLKQAQHDLESSYNDMHSSTGAVAYDWACYKCYRAAEKALKAYHYYKDTGKNMTADLPGLLIGVDSNVREIGYKLYKWIGDPNRMQYPNAARFAKIPAEVFTISQAEQAIEYTKELLKKVEDIMYP